MARRLPGVEGWEIVRVEGKRREKEFMSQMTWGMRHRDRSHTTIEAIMVARSKAQGAGTKTKARGQRHVDKGTKAKATGRD